MSVLDDLDQLFPGHRSPERAAEWEAVKARLPAGARVGGVVVARYPFGAFADIGTGFPALLLVLDVAGLTPERFAAGDCCPVGGALEVRVVRFADADRQIRVAQGVPHEDRARAGSARSACGAAAGAGLGEYE